MAVTTTTCTLESFLVPSNIKVGEDAEPSTASTVTVSK